MRPLVIVGLLMSCISAFALDICDSVKVHFQQGKSRLEMNIGNNGRVINSLDEYLQHRYQDSTFYQLYKVEVVGATSPEGSVALNRSLAQKRANILLKQIDQYTLLPDSAKSIRTIARDWEGLLSLVREDNYIPQKQLVIAFLEKLIVQEKLGTKPNGIDPFWELVKLADGLPYRYMYHNLFPELRTSTLYLWYRPQTKKIEHRIVPLAIAGGVPEAQAIAIPQPCIKQEDEPTELCLALKTNGLYDLAAVPNIGLELAIGKHWSVTANWMYAWWSNDISHWYWRIYGGDLGVRYWFASPEANSPLTGHHLGLYGQLFTYDFALNGVGQIGGKPQTGLWDNANYAAGLEYGYSLPIAPQLNLDFVIGLGYMGGIYHEYKVIDDCYVWQATKNRNYWGPTKAEISLVWRLGKDKSTAKKGGNL